MNDYVHYVTGFFEHSKETNDVLEKLAAQGLPREASPLIAPLVLLGWGASIGGLMGATIGAAKNAKSLSALIEDAIANGQVVIVAKTLTQEETDIAQKIIKDSIGDYKDVDMA